MSQASENFQVDLGGVLQLFSAHLYTTADVFVRELIQNGADAIAARKKLEPQWQGRIVVESSVKAGTIIFIDDGIGLSPAEVRDFLSRVGASIKRGDGADRSTYLGQFGVGILSSFMVVDELIVLTRRWGEDSNGIRWTGRSDGTYTVEELEQPVSVGTQVILKLKSSAKKYARSETLREILLQYCKYLSTPILINGRYALNESPPWELDLSDSNEREELLEQFARQCGRPALDVVELNDLKLGLHGVAYVLPDLPANATEQRHDIYLKNMFVTDRPGDLLPRWAGFTQCVINSDRLRPTASRESFYEDRGFAKVRESVSRSLFQYLKRLAVEDRATLSMLLSLQDVAFRQLAREDDTFFDAVIDLLSFETSTGRMTFGDFRRENMVVRVASTVDQFRSVAALAAARGVIVFNGGYAHHEDLLEKAVARDPELTLEPIDGRDLIEQLGRATEQEIAAFEPIREEVEAALFPLGAVPRLSRFDPSDVPAVYAEGADSNLVRALRAARDMSQGLWAELLEAAGTTLNENEELAVLCLNAANPVIQRLLVPDGRGSGLAGEVAKLLYVQALLLSQQPLTTDETNAFTIALTTVLQKALQTDNRQQRSTQTEGEPGK
ncbi:MAG: HSP90 family protein [Pirellulaceae bacterium]|nr:HSP90 family protein [Pirellulaceae bacterium]